MSRLDAYWNHNSAYHPWVLRIARQNGGAALDVGCGDGLLVERLAAVCETVHGIDPDAASIERARVRISSLPNATVQQIGLSDIDPDWHRFDLIIFVASLHHMNPADALRRARALLAPGGEIVVVGLAANTSLVDWILSAIALPVVRIGSWMHRETRDIGVPVAAPKEGLREIRTVVRAILPGRARISLGLYYRYLLHWRDPASDGANIGPRR